MIDAKALIIPSRRVQRMRFLEESATSAAFCGNVPAIPGSDLPVCFVVRASATSSAGGEGRARRRPDDADSSQVPRSIRAKSRGPIQYLQARVLEDEGPD